MDWFTSQNVLVQEIQDFKWNTTDVWNVFLQIGLDAAIDLKIEIYFVKSITVIELQKSLLLSNLFIWVDSILSVRSYPRGISPIPELGQQIPAPPIDPYMTLKEIAIDRSRISLSEIIMEGKKKTHRV